MGLGLQSATRRFACEVLSQGGARKARVLKEACTAPAARWCVGMNGEHFYACVHHVPSRGFITGPIHSVG